MSAIANLLTLRQIENTDTTNLGTTIHTDIDAMRVELTRLREQRPIPFIFQKSSRNALSSNVANDVIIYQGPAVPVGYRGSIQDFNLNYGTVAGTVKWCVVDSRGQIISDVVTGISATQNGQGSTIIEETQSFAVVGQTAGAGTFGVYCTGFIYKV